MARKRQTKICLDCGAIKSKKGLYCKPCGYKHRTRPRGLKYNLVKENPTSFKKGDRPWIAGRHRPSLMKEAPGYDALHEWVNRWSTKPNECEFCGSSRNLEWANKTGEYLRDLGDWLRLCKKCHHRYDYENFGARKVFYESGKV